MTLRELQDYYNDHEEEFIVDDSARVLEILVVDRATAEELRKKLRPGDERLFTSMAERFSKGASAVSGGDLGIFQRGELPEEFERVIFSLRKGQISPVFQSTHGFHIFMLDDWIPRHAQKFYEVQKSIFERLTAEKERAALDEYLNQILKNASIDIYDETLKTEWRKNNGKENTSIGCDSVTAGAPVCA